MKTYRIQKILNNGVIIAKTNENEEVIITGKGIGYNNSIGALLQFKEEYKLYEPKNRAVKEKYETLFEEVPFECIQMAEKIADLAMKKLGKKLNQSLVLNLADHINFAITQYQSGQLRTTLINEEIKLYYRQEYEIGKDAVKMMNEYYHMDLPIDEASSIGFHIINAEMGNRVDNTTKTIEAINDTLKIINSYHLIKDEDSLSYSRLLIHLKYLFKRVGTKTADNEMNELILNLSDAQKIITQCVADIETYINDKFAYQLSDSEKTYLIIHILRVNQTR